MTDKYLIEPDVNFIKDLAGQGGDSLKKCFQCATCSVVCPIAPDNKPFPRKEMIAASWGLKDRVLKNADIWLCHNCGDCSIKCPRGAKPGDVLGALRSLAINEYAVPKGWGNAINDPKKLPMLILAPVIIFIVLGLATGLLDFTPSGDEIVHSKFFSTWLVDLIFVPLAGWVAVIFALGIKNFVSDIHDNAVLTGKTDKKDFDQKDFVLALFRVIPTILKHSRFSECGENKERSTGHLMVLYSFIGLFIVTNIFFIALYGLQIHGPYSQINPVKWLANISGVMLVAGGYLLMKSRLDKKDQTSSYKDWYLIGLVLGLGLSGMLTEITRLAGWAVASYALYFIHLIFVFNLFAFLPFSKLAHLVYRTLAMAYSDYSGRK
jgi:quinone-modifying oxidoreductase subunit QmoC